MTWEAVHVLAYHCCLRILSLPLTPLTLDLFNSTASRLRTANLDFEEEFE
jgi:hypothetical protein